MATSITFFLACILGQQQLFSQNSSTLLPGFYKSPPFEEQSFWDTHPLGIRIYINAPLKLSKRPRTLLIYATPNGNSVEQTLGCRTPKDGDWRMDIQHVAAQARQYRELKLTHDLVFAVLEAPESSWPAFRKKHQNANELIRSLVMKIIRETNANEVILAGHSGGGSFLFGFIEASKQIPDIVSNLIFLDANYSYSVENLHGEKLIQWLKSSREHRLSIVAYDDREIELQGKKVIGPTGGTYRATRRMIDSFEKSIHLDQTRQGNFQTTKGLGNQVQFDVHLNPENKILHTALVGEMNGLLHGLTRGNVGMGTWGKFGGPRAYKKQIQKEPFFNPASVKIILPAGMKGGRLNLPKRNPGAPTGSVFKETILALDRKDREKAVLHEILSGNVPDFCRQLIPIQLESAANKEKAWTIQLEVMPDYLAIGSNADFFRIPMTPQTAWKIAHQTETSLLTSKVSDHVHAAAKHRLIPKPLVQKRDHPETFFEHQQIIQKQLNEQPFGQLVSGIKKDVILSKKLLEKPNRVAIYGWHYPDGTPIQPTYAGHVDWYVDYSHGVRLIYSKILVNGKPMNYHQALNDPDLAVFLSSEGRMDVKAIIEFTGWNMLP